MVRATLVATATSKVFQGHLDMANKLQASMTN